MSPKQGAHSRASFYGLLALALQGTELYRWEDLGSDPRQVKRPVHGGCVHGPKLVQLSRFVCHAASLSLFTCVTLAFPNVAEP